MTALTIAGRELRDRSRLFLICAALAVLPFIAGMLPGARADRAGVIATASSYLALAMALGTAIGSGVSTVMRELVERRLSFYFSKPVPAAAIWFGKAAAAIVASFICFAIIALPAAIFIREWPGPGMWMLGAPQLLAITAAGVIVLFLASHVLASVVRSRSVLIGVDFALAAIAGVVLYLMAETLMTGAALELMVMVGQLIAVAVLLIFAIAPVWQLERGRTDARRSHAALSRFLWPALFAVLAIAGAYVLWVRAVEPEDIDAVQYFQQSPRGEALFVSGLMRGRGDYHAAFTFGTDRQWRRIGISPFSDVSFSRDGSVVAWFEPVNFFRGGEVELHTNRGPSGIRSNRFAELALSDDGLRVALGTGRNAAVYETATGRLLASAAGFDSGMRHAMFFAGNDVLRVIESSTGARPAPLRVFELNVAAKKLVKTGEITVPFGMLVSASHDGSRILLRKARRVVDGRTLATLAELPPQEPDWSAMLGDGRVAELARAGKATRLRITGGAETVLPVPQAVVAGELSDGKLLVRGTKRITATLTGAERVMFVVDPATGAIVQTSDGIRSVGPTWNDPRLTRYDAGRMAAIDAKGKLVWWEPRTGRTERPQTVE